LSPVKKSLIYSLKKEEIYGKRFQTCEEHLKGIYRIEVIGLPETESDFGRSGLAGPTL
jgi:hypothetical protein